MKGKWRESLHFNNKIFISFILYHKTSSKTVQNRQHIKRIMNMQQTRQMQSIIRRYSILVKAITSKKRKFLLRWHLRAYSSIRLKACHLYYYLHVSPPLQHCHLYVWFATFNTMFVMTRLGRLTVVSLVARLERLIWKNFDKTLLANWRMVEVATYGVYDVLSKLLMHARQTSMYINFSTSSKASKVGFLESCWYKKSFRCRIWNFKISV